jgi:phosphotriesterase-related protein
VIETVLGPLAPEDLGRCSMHDHLLSDARMLHAPSPVPAPDGDRVTIENLGFLRWHLLALADNLVLDDPQLAVRELGHAAAGGLGGLVELSTWGLGGVPARLPAISRATGVTVIAGCGVYLDRPHPPWVSDASSEQLCERFTVALTDELDGAGFRAGLIGIVGTSEPITASEARVLEAAAAAAGDTGAALTVRLDPRARRGLEIIERIRSAGCPATQVILGNVDEYIDLPYHRELAATGATLEWCFGNESRNRPGFPEPSDAQRLDALVTLLGDDGMADRCVLGCSVWTKTQLRAYGGMGYEHLQRIVGELARRGISARDIDRMLVANPARLLDR